MHPRRPSRFVRASFGSATALFLIATWSVSHAATPGELRLDGDWAGWAYFEDGDEIPFRMHFRTSGVGAAGTFDAIWSSALGQPLKKVEWSPPEFKTVWVMSNGTELKFAGKEQDGTITGTVYWGSIPGEFELIRSPRKLPQIDPAGIADCAGTYRFSRTDVVRVSARSWGELVVREMGSGTRRTLFATGPDQFFLGSALYVPTPVEAEIRCIRDAAGHVTHLEWREGNENPRRAARFELVEEELSFESAGSTLSGTLIRPSGTGPFGAVVLLGGSSWERRGNVRFRASMFASLGFAALIYDKRGYGDSEGERIVPFSVSAGDAIAAVAYLKGRADIIGDRIGIAGVSRGSWFASIAAASSEDLSFLVLFVPVAMTPAEQEMRWRLEKMRRDGFSQKQVEQARELLALTWRWVKTEQGWNEYLTARSSAVGQGFPDYTISSDSPDPKSWKWLRLNLFYDPIPDLRKTRCPVLALFGGQDLLVPVNPNRRLLVQALAKAGNTDVTTHVVPKAGHNLGVPSTIRPHRRKGLGDEGFSVLAAWVASRFP